MRLFRLRLRLRTLLIAVAVAGMALGGWTMWRRREYCLELARKLDLRERSHSSRAHYLEAIAATARLLAEGRPRPGRGDALRPEDGIPIGEYEEGRATLERTEAERARELARRYRHVARYPWLPMPGGPE